MLSYLLALLSAQELQVNHNLPVQQIIAALTQPIVLKHFWKILICYKYFGKC